MANTETTSDTLMQEGWHSECTLLFVKEMSRAPEMRSSLLGTAPLEVPPGLFIHQKASLASVPRDGLRTLFLQAGPEEKEGRGAAAAEREGAVQRNGGGKWGENHQAEGSGWGRCR